MCGHRRLETLRRQAAKTAACEVREMDNEAAARALYVENEDREDLSDYARGRFFTEYVAKFGVSERELGRRLRISQTAISLCLSVFKAADKVITPVINADSSLYESVVTAHKIEEVNKLPAEEKVEVLKQIVEEKLSTDETKTLVSRVQKGQPVKEAVVGVVNERETRKRDAYDARRNGKTQVRCRVCRMSITVVHRPDGVHELLNGEAP